MGAIVNQGTVKCWFSG